MSSASFFWISAVPSPLWIKTFAILMIIITIAIRPKLSGASKRARMMETTNCVPWIPIRSKNFQTSEEIMAAFECIAKD